jgi:hypothetical protein
MDEREFPESQPVRDKINTMGRRRNADLKSEREGT